MSLTDREHFTHVGAAFCFTASCLLSGCLETTAPRERQEVVEVKVPLGVTRMDKIRNKGISLQLSDGVEATRGQTGGLGKSRRMLRLELAGRRPRGRGLDGGR